MGTTELTSIAIEGVQELLDGALFFLLEDNNKRVLAVTKTTSAGVFYTVMRYGRITIDGVPVDAYHTKYMGMEATGSISHVCLQQWLDSGKMDITANEKTALLHIFETIDND